MLCGFVYILDVYGEDALRFFPTSFSLNAFFPYTLFPKIEIGWGRYKDPQG